jgi:hypothetical protein
MSPVTTPLPFPLAVGDVSGDRKIDFVTPQRVYTSVRNDPNNGYVVPFFKSPGAWTTAVVADFNGNGLADVIAGSSTDLDLDFLNGTGSVNMNPFTVATTGTVTELAAGDIDGDLVLDAVIALSSPSAADALAIAFGEVGGAPLTPSVIGSFGRVEQTATLRPGGGVDAISVIYRSVDPNDQTEQIALLAGSGERLPLAPFSLVVGSTSAVPFNVAAGSFTHGSNVDVVSLAGDSPSAVNGQFSSFRFWLLPASAAVSFSRPVFTDAISMDLHPVTLGASQRATAIMTSGDVDGDGASDVVAVMPYTMDPMESALVVATAKSDGNGGFTLAAASPIQLPFATAIDGEIALDDVDGDGALDLVLLTGQGTTRQVLVMWNDGKGGFAPASSLVVSATTDVPTDFGFAHVDTSGRAALVYVTHKSLVVARATDRTNVARTVVDATLGYATGVAGGDIDGDGVDDIAVADTPSLVLYKGTPVLR